jgi:hypothetical protein
MTDFSSTQWRVSAMRPREFRPFHDAERGELLPLAFMFCSAQHVRQHNTFADHGEMA